MSRDLIIGILFSVLLHVGVLFGDKLIPDKPKVQKVVEEEKKIQLMEMPKFEEPEPEIVEVNEEVKPLDLAPPMQQDVPQLATPDSFVQKIQPPLRPGLNFHLLTAWTAAASNSR